MFCHYIYLISIYLASFNRYFQRILRPLFEYKIRIFFLSYDIMFNLIHEKIKTVQYYWKIVQRFLPTNITSSHSCMLISICSFCHIKQPNIWSNRFTGFTNFNKHIAVHFRQFVSGYSTPLTILILIIINKNNKIYQFNR